MKSGNAECYHNGPKPGELYSLFKKYSVTLRRHDFNEPFWGKYQCDKENTAKYFMWSDVDSGKDLIYADDIFDGQHYWGGVQNFEVYVAETIFQPLLLVQRYHSRIITS